ncbi:peptidoglycan-binding protein [Micromonospora sp. NPDC000089]|uniref:peptidoglycan-binding protein n=1 Tax=unclassified Micromonospora TaxID=2617518 RepID=UPI0036BC2491
MKKFLVGFAGSVAAAVLLLAAPQPAQAAPAWPTLGDGANGANVVTAQFLLRHHGLSLTVDGAYGSGTRAAVVSFQAGRGLTADGNIGSSTWTALAAQVAPGDNNNAVRALQTALNKYGYGLGVDGAFGTSTTNAVNDFKARNALTGGGVVGTTTWQFLVAGGAGGGGAYRLPIDHSLLPRSEFDDPHHDYPAIDLPLSTGVTTYAMAAGTVVYAGGGCGLGVGINADDGAYYQFCHFSSRSVSPGQRVVPGQVIGAVGSTGNSSGPHLHIEIRVDGGNRCPQPMLLALYDGASVPSPQSLPSSGCYSASLARATASDWIR